MGKGAGRPRHDFNWAMLESLASLEATCEFIAESMIREQHGRLTPRTIKNMCKVIERRIIEQYQCNFVEFRNKKLETRKVRLRNNLWKMTEGEQPNPTICIWMSKQHLGYADKREERVTQEKPTEVKIIWQDTALPEGYSPYDEPPAPEEDDLDQPLD